MEPTTSTAGVVLAAGEGRRFGQAKQFEKIGELTLVERVVATASMVCDLVVLVLPPGHAGWAGPPVHAAVGGGSSHGESARIGLDQVPEHIEIVVMASASHPLAGPDLFRRTIRAVAGGAAAAAPLASISDAIKEQADGTVVRSIDKSRLVTVQAPCAFDRAALVAAYRSFGRPGQPPLPPEELEMIERLGGRVELVEGEPTNIHVTTPAELEMARRLVDLAP